MKVLVFDDHPQIVRAFECILKKLGHVVEAIVVTDDHSLHDVAELVRAFAPDLILADEGLHSWRGSDLVRTIGFPKERTVSTSTRPVCALRAMSMAEFLEKEELAGLVPGRSSSERRFEMFLSDVAQKVVGSN